MTVKLTLLLLTCVAVTTGCTTTQSARPPRADAVVAGVAADMHEVYWPWKSNILQLRFNNPYWFHDGGNHDLDGFPDYAVEVYCAGGFCSGQATGLTTLTTLTRSRTPAAAPCGMPFARLSLIIRRTGSQDIVEDTYAFDKSGTCMTHKGSDYAVSPSIFDMVYTRPVTQF